MRGAPLEVLEQTVEDFDVGFIVGSGCTSDLAPDVYAAYNAPFPDDTYKAGARRFPMLVPTSLDDPASDANRNAWETLRAFDKPFLTAFSDKDPITKGGDAAFQREVPGCAGQPHTTIDGGGHFLQEDRGEQLAQVIASWVAGRRVAPSTSTRCSTRSARSRRPAFTTPPTRSTASATNACSR
jgi:haloalkane dehalogenase